MSELDELVESLYPTSPVQRADSGCPERVGNQFRVTQRAGDPGRMRKQTSASSCSTPHLPPWSQTRCESGGRGRFLWEENKQPCSLRASAAEMACLQQRPSWVSCHCPLVLPQAPSGRAAQLWSCPRPVKEVWRSRPLSTAPEQVESLASCPPRPPVFWEALLSLGVKLLSFSGRTVAEFTKPQSWRGLACFASSGRRHWGLTRVPS